MTHNSVKGDTANAANPFFPFIFCRTCRYHEKSNQHDHRHCQGGPKIGEVVIKVVDFKKIVIRSWWLVVWSPLKCIIKGFEVEVLSFGTSTIENLWLHPTKTALNIDSE